MIPFNKKRRKTLSSLSVLVLEIFIFKVSVFKAQEHTHYCFGNQNWVIQRVGESQFTYVHESTYYWIHRYVCNKYWIVDRIDGLFEEWLTK